MSDSVIAALVGLASAVLLELLRHLLMLGHKAAERSADDATSFRQDLLSRLNALEDDNDALLKERDEWQGRYYGEREQRAKAEWQLETLNSKSASEMMDKSGFKDSLTVGSPTTDSQNPQEPSYEHTNDGESSSR